MEGNVALVECELCGLLSLQGEDRNFGSSSDRGADLTTQEEEKSDTANVELRFHAPRNRKRSATSSVRVVQAYQISQKR